MDIGCHLPNQGPLANGDALVRFARAAEERDVASLWVSDHVIFPRSATGSYPGGRFPHPPDKPYLEPVTVLAAAAVCTSRARLGASVFILGHRHPVVMAKMLTSIDALTTGWRCPRMKTEEPMRARVVHTAAAVRATTGSR